MAIVKLTLDDAAKKELQYYYNEKLKKIESERDTIVGILKQLNGSSKDKNQMRIEDVSLEFGFDKNATSHAKIRYILSVAGKCLPTRPIAEELLKLDPTKYKEFEFARKQVASTIRQKVKDGKEFNRYRNEDDVFENGLIEWFNSDGTVKEEYKE